MAGSYYANGDDEINYDGPGMHNQLPTFLYSRTNVPENLMNMTKHDLRSKKKIS